VILACSARHPKRYEVADRQDRRPRGACNLHVGITDDLDFSVATQGYSGSQDSCDAAQQVAVAVVKTLKGA